MTEMNGLQNDTEPGVDIGFKQVSPVGSTPDTKAV